MVKELQISTMFFFTSRKYTKKSFPFYTLHTLKIIMINILNNKSTFISYGHLLIKKIIVIKTPKKKV